eukprot:s55_g10.t1
MLLWSLSQVPHRQLQPMSLTVIMAFEAPNPMKPWPERMSGAVVRPLPLLPSRSILKAEHTAARPSSPWTSMVSVSAALVASLCRLRRGRVRLGASFRWEQGDASDQELRIFMPVGSDTSAKDVELELTETYLRIGLSGKPPMIEGDLWSCADVEDTYFELEARPTEGARKDVKELVLYLAKKRVETWEEVLRTCYKWEPAGRYNEEIRIYVPLRDELGASDVDFQLANGRL